MLRVVALLVVAVGSLAPTPTYASEAAIAPTPQPQLLRYYWQSTQVGNSAELVTLFCNSCGASADSSSAIPLLSVLRDTLGDSQIENDRISYVWLLSFTRPNVGQKILAGVPFFYWRVGSGSTQISEGHAVKPLMDLTKPEQPMAVQVIRTVLQWTVLDPLSMPVRATSRAYRTNEVARERAHLEEAINYLRQAPKEGSDDGLTQAEVNTVIARLALRESLLGGLVGEHQAQRVGEREIAEQETIRSRNWDLLRGFAEKTGLLFESLDVSGTSGAYGLLWFPIDPGASEPVDSSHTPVWKALNLRDPWTDGRLRQWEGPVFERSVDGNGVLLPAGATGAREVRLIPLGAYSLVYPKFPLLMIDFRDKLHVRRNEMTQRTINEITSGIIGISHFTNWYYYAGASAYDFVASRHGRGMDAALRLDSYSQFRSALALDSGMDPSLKTLLQRRIDSVAMNPLDASPDREIKVADAQFGALLKEVSSGELGRRLEKTRQAELADFGKTSQVLAAQAFAHSASLGLFSSQHKNEDAELIPELNRARRVRADLNMLGAAVNSGPSPEVAFDAGRLRAAVEELSELLPGVRSKNVREEAAATLKHLRDTTRDSQLEADCSFALLAMRDTNQPVIASPGNIAASTRVAENAFRVSDLHK